MRKRLITSNVYMYIYSLLQSTGVCRICGDAVGVKCYGKPGGFNNVFTSSIIIGFSFELVLSEAEGWEWVNLSSLAARKQDCLV